MKLNFNPVSNISILDEIFIHGLTEYFTLILTIENKNFKLM